jgi:ribosomal protein S17E
MVGEKVSFDYDDTLTTSKGISLLEEAISTGKSIYIISARSKKTGMLVLADKYRISFDKVFATGSNKAKVEKILELGITEHYDNNQDVIDQLPNIGKNI